MSLKTMPGFGKSGTSRIAPRGRRAVRQSATYRSPGRGARARRGAGRAPARPRRAPAGRRGRPCAARGSARGAPAPTSCSSSPASRSAAVRNVAQVPASMPKRGEPAADGGDLGVALAVEPLAALDARLEQAELLQLRARSRPSIPARSQSSVELDLAPRARRAPPGAARRSAAPAARRSSWRITRSGRNSSRCSRRIVSRRSTSSSLNSR